MEKTEDTERSPGEGERRADSGRLRRPPEPPPAELGPLGGKERPRTGVNLEEPQGARGGGSEGGCTEPPRPALLGPRELGEAGLSRVGAWEPACPGCAGAGRGGPVRTEEAAGGRPHG